MVEAARTSAIDYRRGDSDTREPLRDIVEDLDADGLEHLARAFTGTSNS